MKIDFSKIDRDKKIDTSLNYDELKQISFALFMVIDGYGIYPYNVDEEDLERTKKIYEKVNDILQKEFYDEATTQTEELE